MLPAAVALYAGRRTESGKRLQTVHCKHRCNRKHTDSRCAPSQHRDGAYQEMKFSVILCSVTTKKQAQHPTLSSSCSIADCPKTVCFPCAPQA
ncbi:hypothetical protein AVEN_149224-1 [Araneus ventricosus]|uniref:Uncharacterized protein n=1 Tax=Araneus ventricosus TaxID=182803 RepID=A0A4Y2LYS8_ARAVE|nr:hypothetical protein AVEN_149224-1 [Araneus ventricosus]